MRTSGPAQSAEFLMDVLDAIADFNLPYAVIGALAVSYHGIPRSSADADAFIWLQPGRSAKDIVERLRVLGLQAANRSGDVDDPIGESIHVEDRHANRVDILLGLQGMPAEAVGRCVDGVLLGSSIRILGAEDLIGMKLFAGGPQDISDVRGILAVSGDTLKPHLLRAVAAGFGAETLAALERLLKGE
jgi:hypothetical protein